MSLHVASHLEKQQRTTHPATYEAPWTPLCGGALITANGEAWTSGVDIHVIETASSQLIKNDAAAGRFLIDTGGGTNLALMLGAIGGAGDPSAETFDLDLWWGTPDLHIGNDHKRWGCDLKWIGQYSVPVSTAGAGALSISGPCPMNPGSSSYAKFCDDITDPGTNTAYTLVTKIFRTTNGMAERTWDLAGKPIVMGQISGGSGNCTVVGKWRKF